MRQNLSLLFFSLVLLIQPVLTGCKKEGGQQRLKDRIVFWRGEELWYLDSDGQNQVLLTKEKMESPSMSSTGKIVFQKTSSYKRGENFSDGVYSDIYLFDMGDKSTRQLSNDKQSRWPTISPDGKKVVFERADWIDDIYGCCGSGVWLINLEDMSRKELVSEMPLPEEIKNIPWLKENEWFVDTAFVWLKDEKKISFLRRYAKEVPFAYFLLDIYSGDIEYVGTHIYVLGIHEKKVLVKNLCYDGFDKGDLYLYDMTNSNRILVQKESFGASFSPAGDRFLFTSINNKGEPGALWIMDSERKDKKMIYEGEIWNPKWNTDGSKIMFNKPDEDGNGWELWTLDAYGSNLKMVYKSGVRDSFWSKDGNKIIFFRMGKDSNIGEICITDANGSNLKVLANNASDILGLISRPRNN